MKKRKRIPGTGYIPGTIRHKVMECIEKAERPLSMTELIDLLPEINPQTLRTTIYRSAERGFLDVETQVDIKPDKTSQLINDVYLPKTTYTLLKVLLKGPMTAREICEAIDKDMDVTDVCARMRVLYNHKLVERYKTPTIRRFTYQLSDKTKKELIKEQEKESNNNSSILEKIRAIMKGKQNV